MDKENYKNSYEVYKDSTVEETFQDRSIGECERDENGKILQYKFKILIRNKEPLQGTLSREEMELIYRLYSSEGANLTQRTVSRYFPLYTIQEFRKIISAFDITKASSPFPPHMVDERSQEDLIKLNMQAKENDFLKKFEQERSSLFQKKFSDVLKDHTDLKQKVADFKEFIGDIKIDLSINPVIPKISNNKILVVYLSDMHIGADVSEYALYKNKFNKEEAQKRMQKVYEFVTHTAYNYNIGKICVVNLGDSLDGFDGQTTRGGHGLPQNLNNKDQYKTYFSLMMDFFKNLSECGLFGTIDYYCVGTDNHAGDAGYIANKALEAGLQYLNSNINCVIFDKIMDHVYVGNHTLILHHGKDSKNMFRNLPLYLNDKTENYINQYIDYHNLKGNISFVKGDLHQSTTGFGYRFRYKNAGSFFGSSEWIQDNFGGNGALVDVDIFDGDDIMETRIKL